MEPRVIEYRPDEEVETAYVKLLRAAIEQRRPSRALRAATNEVLDLVRHPLAERKAS